MKKYRLLIADDHAIVREGIRALLSGSPNLEIVGDAADGREVVRLAVTLAPDLILMDLCMPGSNGTESIRTIKRRIPGVKIIVLTVQRTEEHIRAALDAGADGYILKDDSGSELLTALQSIEAGKSYLSPSICKHIVHGYLDGSGSGPASTTPAWNTLTPRECQVLKLVAEGYSNRKIADYLTVSHKTVEKHRSNLMQKLDLHNAPAVTAYAIHNGLLA
jgi:DNA-binding NarL/FixJ family response regulator